MSIGVLCPGNTRYVYWCIMSREYRAGLLASFGGMRNLHTGTAPTMLPDHIEKICRRGGDQ